MSHPLIDKIVTQGVTSVNVSMLSPTLRNKLLTEAGNTLMHQNKHEQAAEAFAVAGNQDALRENGRWFLEQKRYGAAALFLRHVETPEILEELAQHCIAANEVAAAKAIYETLGDEVMLEFLKENF